jgi:putative ABC transport system permease protein
MSRRQTFVPALAAWLLARFLPQRRQEEYLGDLEELFESRASVLGARSARRWYWRQTIAAVIDAINERRRQPREPAGDSVMLTILQDLRYAFRSLAAKPGFTLVAILMLALGIGANVTIFSWVNAVLLDPLPGTSRPNELVQLSYLYRGDPLPSFSYPDYRDIRDGARLLHGVAGRDDLAVGVVIDREAERGWAEIATANFFDVLGVGVVAGRTFVLADDVPGAPAVAVISHDYWTRRFNADPGTVGRQIRINAQPFTIVGVAQAGFQGGESGLSYDMWVPIGTQSLVMPGGDRLEVRGSRWFSLLARLNPGVSIDQARAEFDATIEQMRTTYASQGRYIEHRAAVFPLDRSPTGGVSVLRPVLLILMAVAAVVLLIACANLAGLQLARASARQREIAIRLSMGAGRRRIVQQLLVEGILLAGLGTLAALIVLRWTSGLLIGFAPPSELPIRLNVTVDARVLWFAATIAVSTVILFALAPAMLAARAELATTLRDVGMAGRTFSRHRLRRALVATQVALSIALLVGAGLCIRSLSAATRMTPGFQADGVVVGWLDLFSAGYSADDGRAFYARMIERVRAVPGVESVSLGRRIPLGFMGGSFTDVTVEGREPAANDPQGVGLNYVGPDYATTMRMPMVAGRDLSVDDVASRPRVAIVSEAMVRAFWDGRDPIGARFMFGRPRTDQTPQWITVVGVAKDIKQRSMNERPQPYVFVPVLQFYASTSVLHVRTTAALETIALDLQRAMRELDPQVPFYNVSYLRDHTRAATFQQKLAGDLLVVFGGLALLLAGIGSYGVLSYLVGLRRREIGIRLAVGATRGDVFKLIAGSGARVIAVGLVLGLLLSIGVGMGLQSLLIGTSPNDPVTYAAVLVILSVVAGAACMLPARRAAVLDPMTTLREE